MTESESTQTSGAGMNRPLSPHLQIYRPQLTSVLSITHRITGVALAVGTVVLLFWLGALATGPEAYAHARSLLSSWFGQAVLLAFTAAFYYHLCNGIRHLFWDIGVGFELRTVYASGRAVAAATVALTVLTWLIAAMMGGQS